MGVVGLAIIGIQVKINDEHSMGAVMAAELPREGQKLRLECVIDVEFHQVLSFLPTLE